MLATPSSAPSRGIAILLLPGGPLRFQIGVMAGVIAYGPRVSAYLLEPISKSPEEDDEAGELNKTEEVLCVELPADEDATLPLYPGEKALDQPASHVAA